MTQPTETPRCQVVLRDTLQLAVGGMQAGRTRERVCGLPLVPTEGPCVTCGRELTSLYHEPSLPMAMGGPGPRGHLFVPLLGCSIHGSDRAPLMAMTATPHPAPDTRPRCGGTPGKPGVFVTTRNALNSVLPATEDCKGCPDCAQPAVCECVCHGGNPARSLCAHCSSAYAEYEKQQPAPTPSGDDARAAMKARAEADIRRAIEQGVTQFGYEIVLDALDAAADALQQAREGWRLANETAERLLPIANRAEAAEQRLQALQEEANTTARWAREAEVALRQERERLREVEDALRAAVAEAQSAGSTGFTAGTWARIRAAISPWPAAPPERTEEQAEALRAATARAERLERAARETLAVHKAWGRLPASMMEANANLERALLATEEGQG